MATKARSTSLPARRPPSTVAPMRSPDASDTGTLPSRLQGYIERLPDLECQRVAERPRIDAEDEFVAAVLGIDDRRRELGLRGDELDLRHQPRRATITADRDLLAGGDAG